MGVFISSQFLCSSGIFLWHVTKLGLQKCHLLHMVLENDLRIPRRESDMVLEDYK